MKAESGTKKEKIRRAVMIISAVGIVLSAAYLVYDLVWTPYHIKKINAAFESDESFDTSQAISENTEDKAPPVQEKYADFKTKYPDFAGKLIAKELEMDFPVVQYTDNEYYLKYTIDKVRDKHGALFVDYRNNLAELDRNTIIYGHNMGDGTQFGQLNMFKKLNYYKNCPVITFNTIYKDYKWKVFAAFLINTKAEDDNNHVFNYLQTDFKSDEAFDAYYKEALRRSYFITSVDVTPQDKILTMSTCSLAFEDSRFVVLARLVRDGESEEVDTSAAYENPNQEFPQAVYDKK